MASKVSITANKDIAKIDDMLLQRIKEVEASRNSPYDDVNSYREEFFATLCRDVFNVKK